jgi:hypothetical protein
MQQASSRRQALLSMSSAAFLSLQSSCSSSESNSASSASGPSGKGPAVESLHYSSLRDVARRIQSREISPVELATRMLDRIAAVDGKLKSYATVMREEALNAAKRAEEEVQRGRYRGPLHGVPIAVKDLCYTKGVRTMAGTSIYAGFLPDHDATVVTRLSEAGAVLLGKLNLTEGAMGGVQSCTRCSCLSVGRRSVARRFFKRIRGGDSGRALLRLDWNRYGRLDSLSIGSQRNCRAETDIWTCQPVWRVSPGRITRSRRSHGTSGG